MFTKAWWKKLAGNRPQKPLRRKPSGRSTRRMEVESLEDRWMPATIFVTTTADEVSANGLTSLREAVAAANATPAADTIMLANATYNLSLGQLDLTTSMTIKNKASGINFSTIDAQQLSRIFAIDSGTVVTLDHLILKNGLARGATPFAEGLGGAIISEGNLTVNKCQFLNNTAEGYSGAEGGPGDAYGGAILTHFTGNKLTVKDSTFDGNVARGGTDNGGNGYNGAGAEGGAISFGTGDGTHSITASTFVNNRAIGGDSSYGGEGYYPDYSNGGNAYGGAISIAHDNNTVKIVNSTFAYNSAEGGDTYAYGGYGGRAYGGAIVSRRSFSAGFNDNTVNLVNNTIAYNQVVAGHLFSEYGGIGTAYGGGVANLNPVRAFAEGTVATTGNVMNVVNTIIAKNTADHGLISANHPNDDVFGDFNSLGHNLIGATDGSNGFGADGDLTGTSSSPLDPGLETDLKANGANASIPKTLALLYTSAAVNAGDNAVTAPGSLLTSLGVAPLVNDERGPGFLRKVTTKVDIGAFEAQLNLNKFYAFRSRGVPVTFTVPAPGLLLGAPALPSGQFWQVGLFGAAPDAARTTLVVNPDGSFSFTVPPRYRNTVQFQFRLFLSGSPSENSVTPQNGFPFLGTPTNFIFTATIRVTPLGGRGSAGAFLGLGLG